MSETTEPIYVGKGQKPTEEQLEKICYPQGRDMTKKMETGPHASELENQDQGIPDENKITETATPVVPEGEAEALAKVSVEELNPVVITSNEPIQDGVVPDSFEKTSVTAEKLKHSSKNGKDHKK